MALSADLLRGYTDTIILKQLEEADSYGYEISRRISKQSRGALELKEATLYTAFRRMENGGFIISYWGNEGTAARRRYYSITVEGRNRLAEELRTWKDTKDVLNTLLEEDQPREVLQAPKSDEIPVIRVEE